MSIEEQICHVFPLARSPCFLPSLSLPVPAPDVLLRTFPH